MATLLIYTNINLPFVHFVVCWAFKTVARGQRWAASKGAMCSLGIEAAESGIRERDAGIWALCKQCRYVDNMDREVERKESVSACVSMGGWPGWCSVSCLFCYLMFWHSHGRPDRGCFLCSPRRSLSSLRAFSELRHCTLSIKPPSPPLSVSVKEILTVPNTLGQGCFAAAGSKMCNVSLVFSKMSNFPCKNKRVFPLLPKQSAYR